MHLFVEARRDKSYWLHVAVPAEASLRTLDRFLRHTWLECCGHLSAFDISVRRHVSQSAPEMVAAGMHARLSHALSVGTKFSYESTSAAPLNFC